jgi:hypothetical protein
MKKIVFLLFTAVFLIACTQSKEKTGLREALIEKLKDDQDLKDYKLDSGDMADCIVSEITDGAPGIPGDPRRTRYLEAYTKFVSARSPADAEQAIKDYQDLFDGPKGTHAAVAKISDYEMSCMGGFIEHRAEP